MARAALLHLLRSQFKQRLSPTSTFLRRHHRSGYHPFRLGTLSDAQSAETNFNPATHVPAAQKRWASEAAAAEDDNKISIGPRRGKEAVEDEKDTGVVYYGPISSTIKKLKLLPLSTCCLSVSLGPVITFMTSPDMNVILKGAVASSVIFLGALTTAALHWFVSPYIHELRWWPGSDSFEVEMMSWLATYIPKTIKFADIRPPETNSVAAQSTGRYCPLWAHWLIRFCSSTCAPNI